MLFYLHPEKSSKAERGNRKCNRRLISCQASTLKCPGNVQGSLQRWKNAIKTAIIVFSFRVIGCIAVYI